MPAMEPLMRPATEPLTVLAIKIKERKALEPLLEEPQTLRPLAQLLAEPLAVLLPPACWADALFYCPGRPRACPKRIRLPTSCR